jgi:predicted phosphodiesterase
MPEARVAALYDVHGNLPALEAVLAEVRRSEVNLVVVGGDVVPGPMPREALALLLSLEIPVRFLHGNGERAVLDARAGRETAAVPEQAREAVRWVAQVLQPEEERVLAGWPGTLRVEVSGLGEVLFCHATPTSDTEIFTRLTPEADLLETFGGLDVPLVVCGHTHMQFDRTVGGTRVVNAGSVGMPFGAPEACWLLVAPEVELRRTPYDLREAAGRIRKTSYPQAEAFAAHSVLQPPSEAAMLEAFTRSGSK